MWQQLKIQTNAEGSSDIEQILLDHKALSITFLDSEDQPVYQLEPGGTPLWDQITVQALFPAQQELAPLLALLKFQPTVLNRDQLEIENLADQSWERSWMDKFNAMQFGERLWICPSWQDPPDPNAINIMLDPGLAFGSGTHATTALCLKWLATQDLAGLEVIDYGCGSGVLAIAAALMGANRVHAVDNDAQAIAATVDNANRNQIDQRQIIAYLPEALPNIKADLLLANILAEPLHELADRFATLVKPGGKLLLSGILQDQVAALAESYQRWFDMETAVTAGDWCRLAGIRNG